MNKITLFLFSIFFLLGCSNTVTPKGNIKVFEQEDKDILYALRAEQLKDYNLSASLYETLYEKADKKEYLYKSLSNRLLNKDYENIISKVDKIDNGELSDYKLIRVKIYALINLDKLEKAKELALRLVKKSNDVNDYLIVGDIYVKQKKYKIAVKYLESAYVKNYNEMILDKMSIILYVNLQRKKEAIAQLETHSRIHGCSKLICGRLVSFYSDENDVDGLLSSYLRLYEIDKNKNISSQIIKIYQYQREYIKLIVFLENNSVNDKLLLQLYANIQDYKKAYQLADSLYKKNKNVDYIGQSAIYEYEASSDKNDKLMLKRVIKKLKKVVQNNSNTAYFNYYGYLLIDHNIDIKDGIKYINMALKLNPNSAFYLDSLAWGYYKLGNCKKANDIMEKVLKLDGSENEEVVLHYKKIKKCIKLKKGKK